MDPGLKPKMQKSAVASPAQATLEPLVESVLEPAKVATKPVRKTVRKG
jgi:hypothetical protein